MLLKYVPECWRTRFSEFQISNFFREACPRIPLVRRVAPQLTVLAMQSTIHIHGCCLSSNVFFSGVINGPVIGCFSKPSVALNNFYKLLKQGHSQDFSKSGGGGVTLCQSEGTHQIVMSFLPPAVGCLLQRGLTKGGGGHGHPRTPLSTPLLKWIIVMGVKL